jgi:hypothetical protein
MDNQNQDRRGAANERTRNSSAEFSDKLHDGPFSGTCSQVGASEPVASRPSERVYFASSRTTRPEEGSIRRRRCLKSIPRTLVSLGSGFRDALANRFSKPRVFSGIRHFHFTFLGEQVEVLAYAGTKQDDMVLGSSLFATMYIHTYIHTLPTMECLYLAGCHYYDIRSQTRRLRAPGVTLRGSYRVPGSSDTDSPIPADVKCASTAVKADNCNFRVAVGLWSSDAPKTTKWRTKGIEDSSRTGTKGRRGFQGWPKFADVWSRDRAEILSIGVSLLECSTYGYRKISRLRGAEPTSKTGANIYVSMP